MKERQVRTQFDSSNPEYRDSLRLRSCLINSLHAILPNDEESHSGLPNGTFESESAQHSYESVISDINSDGDRRIVLRNAELIVPGEGQMLRITRTSDIKDWRTGEEQQVTTAEALFNVDTHDGGFQIGRTLYLLGDVAVKGSPLRQKTDLDTSLYTNFAKEYLETMGRAQTMGELALAEGVSTSESSLFSSLRIKPVLENARIA